MLTWCIIWGIIALFLFGPLLGIKLAGYLIQKYKFGVPFKETYRYHQEQDKLEREAKENL